MAPIFSIAFIVGGALGLRFRFLILVPAFLTTSLILVAIGTARQEAMTAIFFSVATGLIGLQAGYVAGILARTLEGLWRASDQRSETTAARAPGASTDRTSGANVAVLKLDGHQKQI